MKCADANPICPLCRVPNPTTEAEVLARLQRRADKGDKVAQCTLGEAYVQGNYGLKKNMTRSVHFYELSAAQGYSNAQFSLAVCYIHGLGVKMDKKKALHYWTMAASQGDSEAQFNTGLMYYRKAIKKRRRALLFLKAQTHDADLRPRT